MSRRLYSTTFHDANGQIIFLGDLLERDGVLYDVIYDAQQEVAIQNRETETIEKLTDIICGKFVIKEHVEEY